VIVEIGHFALILALAVAVVQMGAAAWSAYDNDEVAALVPPSAAMAQFGLLSIAFGALIYAYVSSDFSVQNVFQNSHSAKPLLYKISGTWGNHEGSMLLWVLILALVGAAVAAFGNNLPLRLKRNVLGVQGCIGVAFLLFIVIASNPFERLYPAPVEGQGLNPILQDPALAIHPPFLYTGYVGFSMAFSFAIAALLDGHISAAWARWVRPWTLAAWMFLTIGIALGRGGPTMSSAGAAGGSGILSKMLLSCPGSPAPHCCTRRWSWRSATRSRSGRSCSLSSPSR
jgi:cytochrome c-type biogenesis protein CcmF